MEYCNVIVLAKFEGLSRWIHKVIPGELNF